MCVLAVVAAIAACGESPTPPNEVVQNYLNALGAGNYVNACGYLDVQARDALVRSAPIRTSCPAIFRRCLPHQTIVLNQDQTQLLYANIDVSTSGSNAAANVSGTLVATELKHVTLRDERGVWMLTGFGEAIERCRLARHHHSRKRAA
ncbi:MAG: hypothetical protein JO304_05100 [Solirubrobacterales bacterium]|nr:hypothetical protein [Solirubrobacterales bacterium]